MHARVDTAGKDLREYKRSEVVHFRKTDEEFGGLSNMAPGFPLRINGTVVFTSEALYQACRFPHLPEVQRLIISQTSPMTAKMKSKPHRKDSRPDWDAVRVKVMRWCLRVKLAQHPDKFGSLLQATDTKPIVEESLKDDFWGAKPQRNGRLVGQNVLGRLLMELRQWAFEHSQPNWLCVEPPSIIDFRFLGKEIPPLYAEPYEEQKAYPIFSRTHTPIAKEPTRQAMNSEKPVDTEHEPEGTGDEVPKECKRLAEVDFPVAEVSKHAAREKSIRHGHPNALHIWWARRPLASSRAVLLGLLLPDPVDALCPQSFKATARKVLPQLHGNVGATDYELRQSLLRFIGQFASWEAATNSTYLQVGRALVKAAHPKERPLVVDPFAGGGSIPFEALRLRCETFASDLNPVACSILKALLEDIPREGVDLGERFRRVGASIKSLATERLSQFYPRDGDGATPIAYIWARTVRCESPNCGAEIPLVRSLWLVNKRDRKRALRPNVVRKAGEPPVVDFEVFEPRTERDVPGGTVARAKATCIACGAVLSQERMRFQLAEQRGGADVVFDESGRRTGGARMLAVVIVRQHAEERDYRVPSISDYLPIYGAQKRIVESLDVWHNAGRNGLCPFPNEPLPPLGTLGFRVQRYGILQWGDLFSARQKLVLSTLADLCSRLSSDDPARSVLALAIGRQADYLSSLCTWHYHNREKVNHTFSRQALPFVTDFVETVFSQSGSGSWDGLLDWSAMAVETVAAMGTGATVVQADAAEHPLPDESAKVWFTDPPYYDAVPYADLSDFFLVWLKRALPESTTLSDPFDPTNALSPKTREAVQDETKQVSGRAKDRQWFEEAMTRAFSEGRRILAPDGVGAVVFAHKTTEGWEALLSGMIQGGWTITGSWPLATEMANRLRARESAALATSVHLVCRPRMQDGSVGDWGQVLRELPKRVGSWMERLQTEGIRGADLVFACIGPALELFSRYARVETPEGREVKLNEYLEKVWEVVGRTALENVLGTAEASARNGAAGALEEDARLTALFLWTLQASEIETNEKDLSEEGGNDESGRHVDDGPAGKVKSGYSLVFDVVRRFAQPLGIALPKWEERIVEIDKGVVRLLPIAERSVQLFGKDGASAIASRIEQDVRLGIQPQLSLFPEEEAVTPIRTRSRNREGASASADDRSATVREATTLDRLHAAMLLQRGGRTNALRVLIQAEQEKGPDFLRLANALTALYPKASEEKRLLDAMLLAVPR